LMSSREPQAGDRVRVEYEGTVVRKSIGRSDYLNVKAPDGTIYCPHKELVTVIEPEYEVDAIYQDATGVRFRRNKGDWFKVEGHGVYCGDDTPKRPLRKLVPENA
jgi:hypothetical protein